MSFGSKIAKSLKNRFRQPFRHSGFDAVSHFGFNHTKYGRKLNRFFIPKNRFHKWGLTNHHFMNKMYGSGSYNDASAINVWYGSPNNRSLSQMMGGR